MSQAKSPRQPHSAVPWQYGLSALVARALWHRRLSVALTVLTLALSVALFLSVSRLQTAAKTSFLQTVSGIDLIVAPRDSDINILLYSVFGLGAPSAALEADRLAALERDPDVAWIAPVSLGDSHRSFQVLGTTSAFFEHLRLSAGGRLAVAKGQGLEGPQQVVLGAQVARKLGYELGQKLVLSHGLGLALSQAAQHQERPFEVVGVLAPTGTPFDRRLYIAMADMEGLHEGRFAAHKASGGAQDPNGVGDAPGQPEGQYDDQPDGEHEASHGEAADGANLAFVGLKSPALALRVQARLQSRGEQGAEDQRAGDQGAGTRPGQSLTAVLPGLSLARLWGLVGQAEAALRLIAALVLAVALLGLIAMLVANLNERRREMAIFRALGARPRDIAGLLLAETMAVAVLGVALGLALTQGATALFSVQVAARYGLVLAVAWPSTAEVLALAMIFAAALIAGLIPALLAYRQTLADGLAPQT